MRFTSSATIDSPMTRRMLDSDSAQRQTMDIRKQLNY